MAASDAGKVKVCVVWGTNSAGGKMGVGVLVGGWGATGVASGAGAAGGGAGARVDGERIKKAVGVVAGSGAGVGAAVVAVAVVVVGGASEKRISGRARVEERAHKKSRVEKPSGRAGGGMPVVSQAERKERTSR